ncbi:Pectinesterase inhibitor domain containing protein [Heracleum sosnowskyi]|uniref:Pectinesterase inhibitor domain containing protein n=1 Tax=Heracleum sosnowskyi TaxID=360622 RepID=A0AAD8LW23_9APIA|nr:Pectinesterase inhibitor domain containing protein [Heracleum sosnowskyi]
MKSKLIILSFTLFFFNSGNAICVPRNRSVPSPFPHTPPNLIPVSSTPSLPKAPTPSLPAPKAPSSSSPKAPVPSLPAPSLPKAPTPSLPAPKAPSSSSPKAPVPSLPAPSLPKGGNPQPGKGSPLLGGGKPLPGGGGDNPGLKKICNSTDYPDVCLSTLGLLVGPATDPPTVLGVAIKAGLDFAKTAKDAAQQLATKPGTPPDEASPIKDCTDNYDDVLYNFQKAADALPQKDIGTMNTMLSAALTDVEDCNDAFEGRVSSLATFSDTLMKMASNCLAIVDVMNKPPV